jgi:fructokinase
MIAVSGPGPDGSIADVRGSPGSLYFHGTASWQWSSEELRYLPATTTVLYIGSLAGCVPPGSGRILRTAARQRSRGVTVFADLSVCPEVVGTPGRGRLLIDRLIRSADVVKASIDDIGWLHPGRSPEAVACQWLALGPKLAVITCGADGVMAINKTGAVVHRPAHPIRALHPARALHPVGADDAFTASLLGGLHDTGGSQAPATSGIATLIDSAIAAACVAPASEALPAQSPLAPAAVNRLLTAARAF